MKLKIWTRAYRPFILGGNCHYQLSTTVEVDKAVSLGKGFKGHIVTAPNGETLIAEATSGGLVGPDLKSVRKDVKEGPKEVMVEQIAEGVKLREKSEEVEPEKFWQMMGKEKS